MLVLTRKLNEAIMIGDGVQVRILRIGRDGVRLGIDAAQSVTVHRREVYDVLCGENRTASAPTAFPLPLVERLRHIAAQQGGEGASLAGLRRVAAA